MEEKYKSNSFKKLLDRLQEDSWQLELLISGFAIFGLFYALKPISYQLNVAQVDNNQVFVNFFIVVYFALQILIFNLLLHVLLRGLWIGSLGMRYVFGEINYNKLNYSEQFTKYLQKNVGSFDAYIGKLENICSVIFALSFLLIFYIFSFFAISFTVLAFQNPVAEWLIFITRIIFGLFALGAFLTFVDFLTQGFLKKNRLISKFYFPFYWVFSFLTLSFLYRPLIYNLLDNKRGKRISFILIPIYILIYVVFHIEYQKSNFITLETTKLSNSIIANGRNYEDFIEKNENLFRGEFVIQSKVISDPYIQIFVPLHSNLEDSLIQFNPLLKPEIDKRGLFFRSKITFSLSEKKASPPDFSEEYLKTFQDKYRFSIDNTLLTTNFVIVNNNGMLGFETYVGIKDLAEGKHVINLLKFETKNTNSPSSIHEVPFWYYKT